MMVLRYRSTANASLAREGCFVNSYPVFLAVGVGAVVMGICVLVMAVIAEPRGLLEGYELHGGLLTVAGIVWLLALESIKHRSDLRTGQSSVRRVPSISEKTVTTTCTSRTPSVYSAGRPPSQRSAANPLTVTGDAVEDAPSRH